MFKSKPWYSRTLPNTMLGYLTAGVCMTIGGAVLDVVIQGLRRGADRVQTRRASAAQSAQPTQSSATRATA